MTVNQIMQLLEDGKTVTYTVRRLRGYLHGQANLTFHPEDIVMGEINIKRLLKNFRYDEKPYDNPRFVVS